VRYVGGTWRVGGLLALSRAFGDAYLKGSLQVRVALGEQSVAFSAVLCCAGFECVRCRIEAFALRRIAIV
jgi:hypothetical protein